jgi:hypothetical protein
MLNLEGQLVVAIDLLDTPYGKLRWRVMAGH